MEMKRNIGKDVRLRPFLPALVTLLIVYLPAIYDLVLDWFQDSNYSHGILIPFVSGYFLWQKRQELSATPVSIENRGLFFVVGGMALFVLGNGAAEYFTLRVSLIVTFFGLVYYLFGQQILRKVWFELAFLIFMVPIPYVIYYTATFPMQLLASKTTAYILNGIGMAVYRQGNIIHIEGFSLEVAEACSGMRSLISLLALGAIFARLTQKRLPAQILLFLSTIPIAIASNVIRVLITSLIAYTVTHNVTEEPMHTLMGLLVFVVAFVLLFITGFILRRVFK